MLYQLRINCFFSDQAAFDDVVDKLNDAKPDMVVIHPGQPDQECSVIEQIECHHDEVPPSPCTLMSLWDNCPIP